MDRCPPAPVRPGVRWLICAASLSAATAVTAITLEAQKTPLPCGVDLKLLVLSADGTEADLPAITQTLDYLGTPYAVHIASREQGTVTTNFLSSGCHGFYQGIIQTTASLGYTPDGGLTWLSALTPAETQALASYESVFQVRQINWYAFPTPDLGLFFTSAVDTSAQPLAVTLTPQGRLVFPYLSAATQPVSLAWLWPPAAPLQIKGAYTYLASSSGPSTSPLIVDAQGNILAAVSSASDGREVLTMTFDGSPYLTHTVALGYGLINWVTRGVFVGERRVYMSAQIDDLFIHNDQWLASTPCGTPFNATGQTVRVAAQDYYVALLWQGLRRLFPVTADIRLTMAYNGVGTTGRYPNDDLTPAAKKYGQDFYWVSHTYTHPNFDGMTYYQVLDEVRRNQAVAKDLKLTLYTPLDLVTPNVSGLANPDAMRAVFDAGVRYIVSDTSKPGQDNPFPNVGMPNQYAPGVYMIPRRPTNLYYNVAAPADWENEYNCIYQSFWGRNLSYAEIVNEESQHLLMYMLRGEMDPWMFHQPNLKAYDGIHSLLSDLLDATLAKYQAIYNLPIESPSMDEIGGDMQARVAFLSAGVSAVRAPDGTITITAARSATVPITGLSTKGADTYGGQSISRVQVSAGRPVVVRPR